MASLVVGGIATLLGAGSLATWGIPAAVVGGLLVTTMGGGIVGFGVRQLVFQPLLWLLPWPARLVVSTVDLCFSGVLLVVGTARAGYHGARLMAGAAYLVVAGLVTGTVLVIRFVRRESAQETADRVQCLASTTEATPSVAVVDDSAPSQASLAPEAIKRSIMASSLSLASISKLPPPSSSSSSSSSPASSSSSSPFAPLTNASSAKPTDSIADLSLILNSLTPERQTELALGDLPAAASISAAASGLYPELSNLKPELEFDDWEFVRASMTAEQMQRELAKPSAEPAKPELEQEAVAQCSLAGLSKLLSSYNPEDIAEISLYESADVALSRPIRSLTMDELRQMVSTAQLSLAAQTTTA